MTCPICRKNVPDDAPDMPFCSERCKLIDLGKWLGEQYTISDPLRPEHLEAYADLPPGEHLDRPESD